MAKHYAVAQSEKFMPANVGRQKNLGVTFVHAYEGNDGLPEEKVLFSIGPFSERRGLRTSADSGTKRLNPLSFWGSASSTVITGAGTAVLGIMAYRSFRGGRWGNMAASLAGAGLLIGAMSPREVLV